MKITETFLEAVPPHTIFAAGLCRDVTDGVNITGEPGKLFKWVAQRGWVADWAVYVGNPEASFESIAKHGDKLFTYSALVLVDCDEEAAKRYRL